MPDPTPDAAVTAASSNTERFYTQVKSLHEFDKIEVRCVIDNLLSKTDDEACHLATYVRTQSNIESLLLLNASKHVQAIAMIARALFELAVDSRLLETIPNAWIKATAHAEVEKLRLANRIINFKRANPAVTTDTEVYQNYIDQNAVRITAIQESIWPGVKKVEHWSGMTLAVRCATLKAPFDQMYAEDYPRISWYTHPGLTGISNVPFVAFIHVCAYAYNLAVKSYEQSLLTVIRVFKLSKGNEHIEDRLGAAMKCPFADTDEQKEVLRKQAGL
ncbi:MAG: hypothetical protein LAN36_05760 [Acidobacteriia bacterium]|nr:hypothetical protein [Terriglobia bacterium]